MAQIAVFSDLHLSSDPQAADNQLFLKTLRELRAEKITQLWLLGDIYDLLVAPIKVWSELHVEVFSELEQLAAQGCRVLWLEGNHDFFIQFLSTELGIEVRDEVLNEKIEDSIVHLAHGDLANPEDRAYLRWRAVTRNALFRGLLRLSPDWFSRRFWVPFGINTSAQSRKKSRAFVTDPRLKNIYRDYARDRFRRGSTAVFLGHCHIEDLLVDGDKFYLNLGSWLGPRKSYAVWSGKRGEPPEIRRLS